MNNNIFFRNTGWYKNEVANEKNWIRYLTPPEKHFISVYLTKMSPNLSLNPISHDDSLSSSLKMLLDEIMDSIINKNGFIIIKQFINLSDPLSINSLKNFYFKFCQNLGYPLIQNKNKEYLFDVKEVKNMVNDSNVRGAQLNTDLPLHADHGGILGMFCFQQAELGGNTLLASTDTVHDEIGKVNPEILNILYQPFYGDRRGQEPAGQLPYDVNPIFSIKNDELLCQYVGIYYRDAPNKFPNIPTLSSKQIEALDLFEAITNRKDIQFEVRLEPGDVIFLNNNKVLHGRTAFGSNCYNQITKRHLIRIWLSTPKIKSFPHYYGYPMPYL